MLVSTGLPFHAPAPTDMPSQTFGANEPTTPITSRMSADDAADFDAAAAILRHSPTGAAVLDAMIAKGANVTVESPEVWSAHGYDPSVVAVTTTNDDTIHVQRDVLHDRSRVAYNAVLIAHEGKHLIDHLDKVDAKWMDAQNATYNLLLRYGSQQSADNFVTKARHDHTMIDETRAYITEGKVAREIDDRHVVDNDYAKVAANADDPDSQDTWDRTEAQILYDPVYNPERLASAPLDWDKQ